MSSKPGSALIPALNLVANMAGLYPPLSALPLAVSILTSLASSTAKSPNPQATAGANMALCMVRLLVVLSIGSLISAVIVSSAGIDLGISRMGGCLSIVVRRARTALGRSRRLR